MSATEKRIADVELQFTSCVTCAHYWGGGRLKCSVYPTGIPEAILTGAHDHKTPYAGDNGVTYEAGTPID